MAHSLHSCIRFVTHRNWFASLQILCDPFSCSHCYLCFTRTPEEKPSPRSELTTSRDSRVPWEGEVVAEPVGALRVLSPPQTLPALTASPNSPALSDPRPTATQGAPWPDPDGVVFWYSPSTLQAWVRHLALTRLDICEWLRKQPTLFVQGYGAGSDLEASLCHVFGGR